MILLPEETERFYRVWFPLLHYVNVQRHLVASFPATWTHETIPPSDVAALRDALWADDALRERFLTENPARLPPADLELVASWQHRLAGKFFIERYLKKHTIFLSERSPAHAYGVLGLVSPIEDIVGPYLPIYVQAVLLPFDGRIIYDSLVTPYNVIFGSGIRNDLKAAYRDAQEREGIITTLLPTPESVAEARAGTSARTAKLLAAFRKDLFRSGLNPKTVEQHVGAIDAFAQTYMLAQEPPRGLLDLTPADLHGYVSTVGKTANRVSFKRFIRFLVNTGRLDPTTARDLSDAL